MTNEEAIKIFEERLKVAETYNVDLGGYDEAMRMAIDSLGKQKVGKWIEQNDYHKHHYGWYFCSECDAYVGNPSDYCPRCGCRMEVEEINNMKYKVCCPLCDNFKCVRGTDECEAEIWAKQKKQKESEE